MGIHVDLVIALRWKKKNNRSYFSLRLCHEFAVVVGSHVLLEEITDQSGPFSLFF